MSSATKRKHGDGLLLGNKAFYTKVAIIVVPIIIQNTVTNVVGFLDNVMVGQVGTLQMSAVAIINQLLFVFNLCIFGGLAGPGIFSTQYVGANDTEGVRNCFRIKIWISIIMTVIALAIFTLMPDTLINMYLKDSAESAAEVLKYAKDYLFIMIIGLLPFAMTSSYAMTLRENGETTVPMIASVTAIFVNLIFNWVLIFGHLGFPVLGVKGAAIATVMARFIEFAIIVTVTHSKKAKFRFIDRVYITLKVPVELTKRVMTKGLPLLLNEFLWSSGLAAILACYSTRGIDAVAACNIASTVNNLFNVVFLSMGNAVAIMIGQALGADEYDEAKELSWKLMATAFMTCLVMGTLMFVAAPFIPLIYNTEPMVMSTASDLLRVLAILMPFFSIAHCCYFTLRAGGKTIITFFFDCVFTWTVEYGCALVLTKFTGLPILPVYFAVQAMGIIKGLIGIVLVKKGVWIENIT